MKIRFVFVLVSSRGKQVGGYVRYKVYYIYATNYKRGIQKNGARSVNNVKETIKIRHVTKSAGCIAHARTASGYSNSIKCHKYEEILSISSIGTWLFNYDTVGILFQ